MLLWPPFHREPRNTVLWNALSSLRLAREDCGRLPSTGRQRTGRSSEQQRVRTLWRASLPSSTVLGVEPSWNTLEKAVSVCSGKTFMFKHGASIFLFPFVSFLFVSSFPWPCAKPMTAFDISPTTSASSALPVQVFIMKPGKALE
jgi:hypothetical protein